MSTLRRHTINDYYPISSLMRSRRGVVELLANAAPRPDHGRCERRGSDWPACPTSGRVERSLKTVDRNDGEYWAMIGHATRGSGR